MAENNGRLVHLDLSAAGFKDQWVDFFDPKYLTQRKWEQTVSSFEAIRDGKAEPGAEERFFRERIAAWHLKDEDTGESLSDPANDDLKALTLEHSKALMERILELFNEQVPAPLRRP